MYSYEPPERKDPYGGVVGDLLYMWGGIPNLFTGLCLP